MSHKITLVDDDQNITTSVSMALKAEGFDVNVYNDGRDGLEGIQKSLPDLAILDVKMPHMDGIELIKELRKEFTFPIIFLTSKDDEIDEIVGLRMGADDYITKPFSQRLLVERIRVLLRRKMITEGHDISDEINVIARGELRLDDAKHTCTWKNQAINLTVSEYLLLKALIERVGHVKSRDNLIDFAYGSGVYVDDRTIDSHIKRIRKKFKEIDPEFNNIETVYGVGYKYKEIS
ncbi:MAG: response regulator transcription factor [Alphaproteobacteria bacterium]|nr:response regulator transcription factor [Alphaproteobacteria bacterium]